MIKRISWLNVAQWVALSLVGFLLAGGLHFPGSYGAASWTQVTVDPSGGVLGFVFGAITGLMIAGMQALLLQAWGLPVRAWLVLNAIGYGLVHAVADTVTFRPLTTLGGGIIVAVCQYAALRTRLTRPLAWLPLAAGAWWLAFGLTAGAEDYNYLVVMLALAGATGLGLQLLFVPAERSTRPGPASSGPKRLLLVVGLTAGAAVLLFIYAALSGLLGVF